jgi:hypothetical protein
MGEEIAKPSCRAFRIGLALMVLLFAYPGMLMLLQMVNNFWQFPEWFRSILREVYAAYCISAYAMTIVATGAWLGVRIINRRERWAKWMAGLLVGSCVGYPLSVGLFSWLLQRGMLPGWAYVVFDSYYYPFVLFLSTSETGTAFIQWYIKLWGP